MKMCDDCTFFFDKDADVPAQMHFLGHKLDTLNLTCARLATALEDANTLERTDIENSVVQNIVTTILDNVEPEDLRSAFDAKTNDKIKEIVYDFVKEIRALGIYVRSAQRQLDSQS